MVDPDPVAKAIRVFLAGNLHRGLSISLIHLVARLIHRVCDHYRHMHLLGVPQRWRPLCSRASGASLARVWALPFRRVSV